jgi:D-alanine--D-alanine ligase
VQKKSKFRVAVLCGGPSAERGISLNSARSVSDHLQAEDIEVVPFYFDLNLKAYKLSRAQLYCNTPSDFDFKLAQIGSALTEKELVKALKNVDLVFPAMHGRFGEDGILQTFLEKYKIPFVGASSAACKKFFDKHLSSKLLQEIGFEFVPNLLILSSEIESAQLKTRLKKFFKEHNIQRAIVKPAIGGSSIGVYSVNSITEVLEKARILIEASGHKRVVVEPFCKGVEFTSIILENKFGLPVCLLPVEIESNYVGNQIFDYRKKYLPSRQVAYHCPARFPAQVLDKIATLAEGLFKFFGLNDFARFDGWLLEDGRIVFTDFNPISGMEQNSFLFLQSSRIGLSHRDVLRYVVQSACRRQALKFTNKKISPERFKPKNKKEIAVLFGGVTAERQVSLMSGTNVWLKLRSSTKYDPKAYFLDSNLDVWKLPYGYALNHTVEEIFENCLHSVTLEKRLAPLRDRIIERLFLDKSQISITDFQPHKFTLKEFIEQQEFVFLALHGGIGENGVLQRRLSEHGVRFNGSSAEAARLCMDKYETGLVLQKANINGVRVPRKLSESSEKLIKMSQVDLRNEWFQIKQSIKADFLIVKPQDDGCSAGVVKLQDFEDFRRYIQALVNDEASIPAGGIKGQASSIEMPTSRPKYLLFEEFIETDKVEILGNKLKWQKKSGWIEVTVGVLGKKGKMRALSPSITVASGNVLSLEEKFQGGTGVNITPPPKEYVSSKVLEKIKSRIAAIANVLGIENYARLDTFTNIETGELCFIEANTLPGLTPSTVIYHQALDEKPAMYPKDFLECIIDLSFSAAVR